LVETSFVIIDSEETLLSLLDKICLRWKSEKGIFEKGLTRLARAIGRKDEMVFVFTVYSCGYNGSTILILSTEYQSDVGAATIWIQAKSILSQMPDESKSFLFEYEARMKALLDSLDVNAEDGTISSKEDFECPFCGARYSSRALLHEGEKVQCQNCAK
jgi:hypothetical protein